MKPISPIKPGPRPTAEVTYAKHQSEYILLPSWKGVDGTVVTRWALTWKERLQVLFTGNIWLTVLTFNRPLQPVKLEAECPEFVGAYPCVSESGEAA